MNRATFWTLWVAGAGLAFGIGRLLGLLTAEPSVADPSTAPNAQLSGAAFAGARERPLAPTATEPLEQPSPATNLSQKAAAPPPTPAALAPNIAPAHNVAAQESIDRSVLGFPTESGVDEGPAPPQAIPILPPKAPAGWIGAPARGAGEPLVVVIVSSDFQCPVCKRVVLPIEQLVRELPDDVRVEFKQHPLSSHARAEAAAVASLAAHRQGKFWEYHDLLFGNFNMLSDADFITHASQLGLDLDQFRKDLEDPALLAQARFEGLAADNQEARGTPGFFINGKKQVGWGSYFGFKGLVTRELEAARALEAKGMSRDEVRRQRARENAEKGEDFVRQFIDGDPS